MKQCALIGPTASGKSDLALHLAKKLDAYILSIDSLSIYKEIDIVSAKPTQEELQVVRHFGINYLAPDAYFSVDIFMKLYQELVQKCQEDKKNLIIVGGSSFYLKSLLQGLSHLPNISESVQEKVKIQCTQLEDAYDFLVSRDPEYMKNIAKHDSYRIEKALLIYTASGHTPSEWFTLHPPQAITHNLPIFNIDVSREKIRERISHRGQKMLDAGLIDEIAYLEQKYTRLPHAMGAIGIVEVLEYLDGLVSKEVMLENIAIHTGQLAKRQQTFNKTQFTDIVSAPLEDLEAIVLSNLHTY